MLSIPISFQYQGNHYTGTLEKVMGAGGSSTYHLMINKFYWGRLRMANGKWIFDPTPQDPELASYADHFASFLPPTDSMTQ